MAGSKHGRTAKPILIVYLLACVVVTGCKKSNPGRPVVNEQILPKTAEKSAGASSAKSSSVSNAIENIINNRTNWNPILVNFYGKEMPDFKVTDINGKEHHLRDYRGKNVMVVLWATWCLPCMQEIPHLKALREIMPPAQLAILAISNESADTVKEFAKSENLNYTVISHRGDLPAPFSSVRNIPTTFFIRPDGILKLVVEGASQLGEMKAIILAD